MNFSDMGYMDSQSEIEKGAIHSSDVKGVTVRLSNDFLEILNPVANKLGISRQAFMSKIIEVYAPQAVADYLGSYGGYVDNDAYELFKDVKLDQELSKALDTFIDSVNDFMINDRAYLEGVKQLPLENPAKLAYKHKERRKLLERHPDASFITDLPPLEEGK